jgi:predicted ATPase
MKYRESQIDKDLRQWFSKDWTKSLLRHLRLRTGNLRGLSSFEVALEYPITAFAGINGAGKSTILAMACCAYHNHTGGFKLKRRKTCYYTFKDFFVQHTNEVSPHGIEIEYKFAHDNWKKSPSMPTGKGIGMQSREKKKAGQWNHYETRIKKAVVFLGIDRIVPHSERSQSRSYSKSFADVKLKGWEGKVKDAVGLILGRNYDDFRYLEYSKYSLPLVRVGNLTYSGFNMGAGESALFEIFSTIYSCSEPLLLVIDEIELGLHAKAQTLFMKKLKEVCKETSTQIICTTHSKEIFDSLPDDARYFVEKIGTKTKVTPGISAEFAFAKMGGPAGSELDIFVEDEVAAALVRGALPASQRTRLHISIIGSASAIARQLAAVFVRGEARPAVAIFDGDQRAKEKDNLEHARNMAEDKSGKVESWLKERFAYLPGTTWPEPWIVQKCIENIEVTASALALDEDLVTPILEYGLQAGKHNEFFEIAKQVGLERLECLRLLGKTVCDACPTEFDALRKAVGSRLQ